MTVNLTYTAASSGWLLVARGSAALLYRTGSSAPGVAMASELWEALGLATPVQAVLDILARRGVTASPDFALTVVDDGGDAVVLVRGSGVVGVDSTAGKTRLDGSTVSTWHETRVPAVSSIELGSADSASESQPGSLRLESGIVWASAATLVPEVATAAAVAPAIAADAAPASVPMVAELTLVREVEKPEPTAPALVAAAPVAIPPAAAAPAPAPAAAPENTIVEPPESASGTEGYSHLFEETVVRSIEDAAVRPAEESIEGSAESPAESTAAASSDLPGDHDGLTLVSGDVAKLKRERAASSVASPPSMVPVAPAVPPMYLTLSTGGREPLTQPILVGRSPSATKVSSGEVPRLVTIPGDQDISRNHARVAVEGDTVVVTDLHSRNGTSVILPGKSPQVLRPGEPTSVIVDTVIDLGGGVTLTVTEGE
jgi:hypothetical protein